MPAPERERETKVIAFPELMYQLVRDSTEKEGITNREMIRIALHKNLAKIEKLLAEVGFAPNEGERKLVRTSLNIEDAQLLREAAMRTGVDATTLLFLSLRRHLGIRLTDAGRKKLFPEAGPSKMKGRAKRKRR